MSSLIRNAVFSSLLAPYAPMIKMGVIAGSALIFFVIFILSIVTLTGSTGSTVGGLKALGVILFLMTLGIPVVRIITPIKIQAIYFGVYALFAFITIIVASSSSKKLQGQAQSRATRAKRGATGIFVMVSAIMVAVAVITMFFPNSPTNYVVSTFIL